ncbi:hypothetical protein Dimus_013172, partial [Dionaea muscipula]
SVVANRGQCVAWWLCVVDMGVLFGCRSLSGEASRWSLEVANVSRREIVVQFNVDVADGMPWKFVPTQREVKVKPGESALAFYTAENRSSTPIIGVSTYNVTPMKDVKKGDTIFMGKYLFTGSETTSVWLEVRGLQLDS